MAEEEQYALSQAQIEHFLEHGWIKLEGCFSREKADELQETMWTRLGMDPNDMSTWCVHLQFLFFFLFPYET